MSYSRTRNLGSSRRGSGGIPLSSSSARANSERCPSSPSVPAQHSDRFGVENCSHNSAQFRPHVRIPQAAVVGVAPLHAAWQDQRRLARERGKVPLEWEGRGASALGLMGMNNNEPRKAIRAPPSRAGAGNTPATRLACHDRSLPALLRGGTALPRGVPSAIEKR